MEVLKLVQSVRYPEMYLSQVNPFSEWRSAVQKADTSASSVTASRAWLAVYLAQCVANPRKGVSSFLDCVYGVVCQGLSDVTLGGGGVSLWFLSSGLSCGRLVEGFGLEHGE